MTAGEPAGGGLRRGRSREIFLITHSHFPDDIRTAKQATALSEAGFSVTVFCLRHAGEMARPGAPTRAGETSRADSAKRAPRSRIDVRRFPIDHKRGGGGRYAVEYASFFFLAFASSSLLGFARRPFAVQVSNPPDFLVFAPLLVRLVGARVVLDMHEPVPELFASIRRVPMSDRAVKILMRVERLSTGFADQVITVSEVCRRTFAARGTPADKIAVVPNACDSRLFQPGRPASDAAAGGRRGVFRLMTHSTLLPRYGIDVAIRAMALLRERIPEARLEVLGRGDARGDLERLAAELGVADRVAFGGFVEPADLPERIARADVGLVPHRRDVFMDLVLPTKLFEYMAMELPVVASRTAGLVDHFGADELYLFDAGDAEGLARAVEQVRADPDEARSRARLMKARCRRDTWEVAKEEYVAVYERLWSMRR